MGIKNLKKFLDKYAPSCLLKKDYEDYKNKTIAIDTSLIIYKYISAMRKTGKDLTTTDGRITSHLLGMLHLICKLLNLNITPVFIFDGKPPAIKKNTLMKRQELRNTAKDKLENKNITNEEKITLFMQSTKISPEIIKDAKHLLNTLGIPYIEAPEEADTQCVCLLQNNLAYAVATEDMDLLTFGCNKLLRNFFSNKNDGILEIDLEKMLKQLKIDQTQLIDLSILLGCDYLPTVSGIGTVKSYDYIKQYKSLDKMFETIEKPENYNYKEVQDYFKNGIKKCIVPKEEDLQIKKVANEDIYKLLVDEYNFNLSKYNNFIIARNHFFK